MARPCESDHTLNPHACRLCHLYVTRDDYNRLWGGTGLKDVRLPKWQLGTWLARVLGKLWIKPTPTCGCQARQEKLNRLGSCLATYCSTFGRWLATEFGNFVWNS